MSFVHRFKKILRELFFKNPFPREKFRYFHRAPLHREPWIFSLFDYRQREVRAMIRYLKNHQDGEIAQIIAEKMHEEILSHLAEKRSLGYFQEILIIPVPLSRERMAQRGFNQVGKIAKNLTHLLGGAYTPQVIKKIRKTRKQALIQKRSERFQNVQNVYAIPQTKTPLLQGRDIIIIDDLSTTGATLLEMRKVLKKAGAREIIAITIAH